MRRIVLIVVLAVVSPASAQARPIPLVPKASAGRMHVDKERQADVLGNGQTYTVRWYLRGPLTRPRACCIRGVEVLRAGAKGESQRPEIIARWAAPPEALKPFYAEVNRLWPTPWGGNSISVAVQYGGRVFYVYMLRLEGKTLKEVWHWGGMSATVMRMNGRLVLKAQSDDYFQPPRLFAWTAKGFGDVSRDYPSFYAKRGKSDAEGIRDTTFNVSSPGVLVEWCRQALADFQLARQPALGRESCRAAIQRVESGRGLARPPVDKSPEVFEQDKRDTVRQLEALIRRSTRSR